jgi:AraC-like DNA-binding protein
MSDPEGKRGSVPHAVRPHPALGGAVLRYFVVGPDAGPLSHRVVPDGCVDLVFNLGDRHGARGGRPEPEVGVVGVVTRPVTVSRPAGAPAVGVVLSPAATCSFLGAPIESMNDRVVDLRELWGREAITLLDHLRDASDSTSRARCLDTFLAAKLARSRPPDPVVLSALRLIGARRGAIAIHELLRELNVPERRLERLFRQWTGLSPKRMCRLAQVDAARVRLARPPGPAWGALASELGFADQAHMIREFHKLTGQTPARYRRERAVLGEAPPDESHEDLFDFWALAEMMEARAKAAHGTGAARSPS